MNTDSLPPRSQSRSAGKRNRLIMLFLLFLLIAPVLFVQYAMYQGWLDGTVRTTNHGERMQPPVGLIQLNPAPNSPLLIQGGLAETWWVVYIVPEVCAAECEQSLQQWYEVSTELGEHRPIEPLLMEPFNRSPAVSALLAEASGAHALSVTPQAVNAALADWVSTQPASQAGYFYLMNPRGSLMMNYPPMADHEASTRRLREDLDKLVSVPE